MVWVEACDPAGPKHLHGLQFSSGACDDRERLCAWLQHYSGPLARMAASLPAKCRRLDGVSAAIEGWTADLGSGGCALFLPERLPVGTLLDVILSTPCGDVPTQGVIVWEGSSGGRLSEHGFRFTNVRPEQAGRLGEILEAILTSRNAPAGPADQSASTPIV